MQKTIRAAGCNFPFKVLNPVQCGMLIFQDLSLKIHMGADGIFFTWHGDHGHIFFEVVIVNFLIQRKPMLTPVLFHDTGLGYKMYKGLAAAVDDRQFRSIHFNQAVIDPGANQCSEYMLDRTDAGTMRTECCTTETVGNQVAVYGNHRLSGQVHTLKTNTESGSFRLQRHIYRYAGMKSGSGNGCFRSNSMLVILVEFRAHYMSGQGVMR